MRRAFWKSLVGLVLVLATSCAQHEPAEEEASKETEKAHADSNRVELPEGAAEQAGITVANAGPATIDVSLQLPGEVKPDSGRVQIIKPRFGGVIHRLSKQVGDMVRGGETIATIQSNESLTDYAVTAAMQGRVVNRGVSIGQSVTSDASLYTIVDFSRVWVEFAIYPHQMGQVRRGQAAHIAPQAGTGIDTDATIIYVGPLIAEDTRVSMGRVILANRDGRWDPGQFVTVTVVIDHAQVGVAVPDEAVVRMQEGSAVFVAAKGGYELRRVMIGRSDGRLTEITEGLAAGTPVVTHNAYVLKSELEKAEFEE